MKHIFTFILLLASVFVVGQTEEIPAFTGAEGGGMYATGGRGGNVYFVTSLEDTSKGDASTGEGTLRWCLSRSGPRTIVFRVAGIIHLSSTLKIPANTTIAGQTAPGDGICLANFTTQLNGSNIIVRYIRFRLGDLDGQAEDAFWGRRYSNIIIDHCSMSWSVDECGSFYDNTNFTLQWSILSESLRNSVHPKGAHGYGGIWGGKTASFHHNLLAHHDSRNPRMCGSRYSNESGLELVDFRNNVIYNWGSNSGYGGEGGSYNFVNNYYKPTSYSSYSTRIFQPYADDGSNSQTKGVWGTFYVAGNYIHGSETVTNDNWIGINPNGSKSKDELKSDVEFAVPYVTTQTAEEAYKAVLERAGASFHRDSTDARVVNEVANGLAPVRASKGTTRGGLIDSQNDVGGWEDYVYTDDEVTVDNDRDGMADDWELQNGLDPNDSSDRNLVDSTGYTMLEDYLNQMLDSVVYQPVSSKISFIDPQVVVYPNPVSYHAAVHFTLSQQGQVKAELLSVTGRVVKIVANQSFDQGYNKIDFEVTGLNQGLYLCKITTNGTSQLVKFLVK